MLPTSDKEGPAICRLIVSPNQVGCLLGKGGSVIAEMRKLSGAFIIVLSKDKIPSGVPEDDEVIQVCFCCAVFKNLIVERMYGDLVCPDEILIHILSVFIYLLIIRKIAISR